MFVVGKKMEAKTCGGRGFIFLPPCFLPPSGCPLLICRLVQVGEVASWKGKLKQEEAEVTETDSSTLFSPLAPVQISCLLLAKSWKQKHGVVGGSFSCLLLFAASRRPVRDNWGAGFAPMADGSSLASRFAPVHNPPQLEISWRALGIGSLEMRTGRVRTGR